MAETKTAAAPVTSIATVTPRAPVALNAFVPENFEKAVQMATVLSKSSIIPADLVDKPENVLIIVLTGHELGITPMQALRGIYVVKGRPFISADLMVGKCLGRPDICEYFRPSVLGPERVKWETKRVGSPPVEYEFTKEAAIAAGLFGSDTYKKHHEDMLSRRAMSKLARRVYPDLLFGFSALEEMDEVVHEVQQPAFVAPVVPGRAPAAAAPQVSVVTKAPAGARAVESTSSAPASAATPAAATPAAAKIEPTIDGKPVEDQPAPAAARERQPGDDDDQPSPLQVELERIKAAIAGAETLEQLKQLVPAIQALPKDAQADVMALRQKRRETMWAAGVRA